MLDRNFICSFLKSCLLKFFSQVLGYGLNKFGSYEAKTLARIEKYSVNGAATQKRAADKLWKYKHSKNPYHKLKAKWWERKMSKYTRRVGKYARDPTKIARMQQKAGKFGKFGKFAKGVSKVMRGVGTLLSVASIGLMIYTMVEQAETERKQRERQTELEEKYDRAEELLTNMNNKIELMYGVDMLTISKTKVTNQLNLLVNYSSSALEETNVLINVWQNITNEVIGLEDDARIGLEASKDEQATRFANILDSIRSMYSRWESIEGSTFHLSNYYYRDEFGNPQDIEIEFEGDLEDDPDMTEDDPEEELINELNEIFEQENIP